MKTYFDRTHNALTGIYCGIGVVRSELEKDEVENYLNENDNEQVHMLYELTEFNIENKIFLYE